MAPARSRSLIGSRGSQVAAIELHSVTRRFGELTAVDAVTLDVEDGEIVGLLGHNGAGKTTLIRVINGLLTPDGGRVRVLGRDPTTHGQIVRRSTGVLTEYPALDEFLTTTENLEVYATINRLTPDVAGPRIDRLLERLGLADKRDEPARQLSAGLKQRVALARALVHDPQILLLDEPTTNMDPVAARGVRDLVVESSRERGRTVLLSTHNLAEAEELCDRVAIMRFGRLLTVGSPAELRRSLGKTVGVRLEAADGDVDRIVALLDGMAEAVVLDRHIVEVTGPVEIPDLVARLVSVGIPMRRVEPLEPTLEDLYVSYHDQLDATSMPRPPSPAGGEAQDVA
jgi:ABC-2 type transport system ATP-binding protein